MAFVKVRIPRTSQPQDVCGVDLAHPFASKCATLILPHLGLDVARNLPATGPSQRATKATQGGLAVSLNGADQFQQYASDAVATSLVDITVFALCYVSSSKTQVVLSKWAGGGNVAWQIYLDGANVIKGTLFTNGYYDISGTTPLTQDKLALIGFSRSGGTAVSYLNGAPDGSTLVADYPIANVSSPIEIGRNDSGSNYVNGGVLLAGAMPHALTAAEWRDFAANPWQIFEPEELTIWVPDAVGAGGGTSYTLTADSAALTLSGTSASLKATQSLIASSTALTLTGQSATLTHTVGAVGYSMSVSSTALTLTGQSATLTTAHKLAASSTAITLAGQSATLTHTLGSAGYGITATSAAITLAGQSATLTTAHKLAASSAAITLTGQSANLSYSISSATYTLVASTAAITLTGQAAALKVASRLAADSAAFEMATQEAALRTGFVLPAASGDMSLSGQDAVLTTSRRLAAESAALVLVGQAAGLVWSGATAVAYWPTPDQVLYNVQYGPTGADYTGTATGGSGPTAAEIASAVLAAAQASPIWADARRMNGALVQGDGTEPNKWRGVGV